MALTSSCFLGVKSESTHLGLLTARLLLHSLRYIGSLEQLLRRKGGPLPAQLKSSPCLHTRWEAASNNLHRGSRDRGFVQLHDFDLSSDRQSLVRAVAVANIAFEKRVSARFTTDDWQTVSDVTAEYIRPEGVIGSVSPLYCQLRLKPTL